MFLNKSKDFNNSIISNLLSAKKKSLPRISRNIIIDNHSNMISFSKNIVEERIKKIGRWKIVKNDYVEENRKIHPKE